MHRIRQDGRREHHILLVCARCIMDHVGVRDCRRLQRAFFPFLSPLPSFSDGKREDGKKLTCSFFCSLSAIVIFFPFHLQFKPYAITVGLSTLLEAFSAQNDNLILPMFGWAVGTLLGV